jgi:hypothetical protein
LQLSIGGFWLILEEHHTVDQSKTSSVITPTRGALFVSRHRRPAAPAVFWIRRILKA